MSPFHVAMSPWMSCRHVALHVMSPSCRHVALDAMSPFHVSLVSCRHSMSPSCRQTPASNPGQMRQYTLRLCRSPEQKGGSNSCALHVMGYMMAVSQRKDMALIVDTPFVKLLRAYFLSLFWSCYETRKKRLKELRSRQDQNKR